MSDVRANLKKEDIEKYLATGRSLIVSTREAILKYWHEGNFEVELKGDQSPLTKADLEAEQMLRKGISKEYSTHGIIGEEYEPTNQGSEFQWTIDPIDGTQNFAAGIPTFGTMLSLRYQNKPIIGIIDHPALDVCISAAYGFGMFRNDKRVVIKDEEVSSLHPGLIINTATRGMFERTGEGKLLDAFMNAHPTTRIYYDCYGHTLAACGNVSGMAEFNVRVWDASPTELLVKEAGGDFVYVRDEPSTEADKYTSFISAVFGKPSVVKLLLKHFGR